MPSLCDRRPDVPPELDALFLRMTEKSPDDRPESVASVLEELKTIAERIDEPPAVRDASGPPPVRSPSPSDSGSLTVPLGERNPKSVETRSSRTTRRRIVWTVAAAVALSLAAVVVGLNDDRKTRVRVEHAVAALVRPERVGRLSPPGPVVGCKEAVVRRKGRSKAPFNGNPAWTISWKRATSFWEGVQ